MPISEVFNEDCMVGMARYSDKYFDLAIVDPPYGIGVAKMAYTQEENMPCKQKNGQTLRVKKLKYKHGDWDTSPPSPEYFDELFRVSKNQIIFGIDYFDINNIGNGRIRWNKLVPEGMSFHKYETAYCSLINETIEFNYLWAGMCQALSLKNPTTQQGNKKLNEKRIHPCHKPINLYLWLLKNYAKYGDKIIDTHLGSQSSRIACWDGGFDFYGWEIDTDYFRDGCNRFDTHKAQLNLFQ